MSRRVSLGAGARESSTPLIVNRVCGSGMQAIALGAGELLVGESDVVVAGGTENMSARPFLDFSARAGTLGLATMCNGCGQAVASLWRAL
ncbi:thiolase family protein [Brachybacterium subflavum]|uniref:thiolase family protein n=1 Tax=Brachybacterium subflavum TaxID=2585206 RepID=UPI0038734301